MRSVCFGWALFCGLASQASASSSDEATHVSPRSDIEWVAIPAGKFAMGSENGGTDERGVHEVKVGKFLLMKAEVTVAQYRACVDAGACTVPDTGPVCNWGQVGRDGFPINCVDWPQALAFASWVGGRLPTEAEWEFAARSGGLEEPFPWGNTVPSCSRAILSDGGPGCGQNRTWAVCSKPAGNSKQGVCDLAGNVWEWVQDGYHFSYEGAPNDGSAWEEGASGRVVRGGGYDQSASYLRATNRMGRDASGRFPYVGFRVAR